MATLNERQRTIVGILRDGSATTQTMAQTLDAPEASVRRNIQELRREGYHISSWQGLWALEQAPAEASV